MSLQHVFATYMAMVAEVEVREDGSVRVRRVVCAVDCGTVINPDTVQAQVQSAIIFGITAALHGQITLKDGRVEQSNFHDYGCCASTRRPRSRFISSRAPSRPAEWARRGRRRSFRPSRMQSLRRRQAAAEAADRCCSAEAAGVNGQA